MLVVHLFKISYILSDNLEWKFQYYMQSFMTFIVNLMKQERLFASQGGPIILAQVLEALNSLLSTVAFKLVVFYLHYI